MEQLNINSEDIKGAIWLLGQFGLEKENVRVNEFGKLALTKHPKVFENRSTHPYITTDFSESQLEMITPPCDSIDSALQHLDAIQHVVLNELKDEYLWPQSLPPELPDEKQIPIAKFTTKRNRAIQLPKITCCKIWKDQANDFRLAFQLLIQ